MADTSTVFSGFGNFTGPLDFAANRGPEVNAVGWTMTAVSLVVLLLRCYCKYSLGRGLWWDDWILILSWVIVLAEAITTCYNVSLGLGRHAYAVPSANKVTLGLAGNIAATLTFLAIVWSKTAFAITLLRITTGWMKWLVWYSIASMNVFMILAALFVWVSCTPVERSYNTNIDGVCWPVKQTTYYYISACAYSAAMDFLLALLPWKLIMNLQMKTKEKVGVAVAMSMGIIAGIASIVKCTKLPSVSSGDFTYTGADLVIWGTIEACLTIVAASIPVLRVLINNVKTSVTNRYDASGTWMPQSYPSRKHNATLITAERHENVCKGRQIPSSDDLSEKSILGSNSANTGIVRTDAVEIQYHDRSNGEVFEMHHI